MLTFIQQSVVDTIEKISNEGDDTYFYNRVLTNNGYHRAPREMHELMRTEYKLADSDEAEEDGNEDREGFNIEWWTAHFFMALAWVEKGDKSGVTEALVERAKRVLEVYG